MKPRLLDLFCGAGGAAMGYHRAGFDVVGVDIKPQPRYPFAFIQGDALEFLPAHGQDYDVIHASPPCQRYSCSTAQKSNHPDLVASVRNLIKTINSPFVIENVAGAPLSNPFCLCGTMFSLCDEDMWLSRHRLFECSLLLMIPMACFCLNVVTAQVTGSLYSKDQHGKRHRKPSYERAKRMMGIDWMTKKELVQAIPPAYTEWIGKQLLKALSTAHAG